MAMFVQRFEPWGRRFANSHHYIIMRLYIILMILFLFLFIGNWVGAAKRMGRERECVCACLFMLGEGCKDLYWEES